MVQFCCVVGCGNRSNREIKGFYRLPHVPKRCDKTSLKADILNERRKQWLMNINREDLKYGDACYSPGYIRVCSDHFVSGEPSDWSDVHNIDWAPTVNMRVENKRKQQKDPRRGKAKPETKIKRTMRVRYFELKKEMLGIVKKDTKIKKEPIVRPTKMNDAEIKGRTTFSPLIHRITTDCIVVSDGEEQIKDTEDDGIIIDDIVKEEEEQSGGTEDAGIIIEDIIKEKGGQIRDTEDGGIIIEDIIKENEEEQIRDTESRIISDSS